VSSAKAERSGFFWTVLCSAKQLNLNFTNLARHFWSSDNTRGFQLCFLSLIESTCQAERRFFWRYGSSSLNPSGSISLIDWIYRDNRWSSLVIAGESFISSHASNCTRPERRRKIRRSCSSIRFLSNHQLRKSAEGVLVTQLLAFCTQCCFKLYFWAVLRSARLSCSLYRVGLSNLSPFIR
jgi:hypothetical protein